MLYEVAILEKPTKTEAEEGKLEKLVFGPQAVVAADEGNAGIKAALLLQQQKTDLDPDRMQVLIRPFG